MDAITKEIGVTLLVADVFLKSKSDVPQAIELLKGCLILLANEALEKEEDLVRSISIAIYERILQGYLLIEDNSSGIEYATKYLALIRGCGKRDLEGPVLVAMGTFYKGHCNYQKAKELYQEALSIASEIGSREGEAACYLLIGAILFKDYQYVEAEVYFQRTLETAVLINDRKLEALCYWNLAGVFRSLHEYTKAEDYYRKSIGIRKEIGDRLGEAKGYKYLGRMLQFQGKHVGAEECLQKSLEIAKEAGNQEMQAELNLILGNVFESRGELIKAEEHLKNAEVMLDVVGKKHLKEACYRNLGKVFVFRSVYDKAEEYLQKALRIGKEIGDPEKEASCYHELGRLFMSLDEYEQAKQFFEKTLAVTQTIGDKQGQANSYGSLGSLSCSAKEYDNAKKYYQKALEISIETGDRRATGRGHGNLGTLFHYLGKPYQAEENLRTAIEIAGELGDRPAEGTYYNNLGLVKESMGECVTGKECFSYALSISKETGNTELEIVALFNLALASTKSTENKEELEERLFAVFRKCEDLQRFLKGSERIKISVLEKHVSTYRLLSLCLFVRGSLKKALRVADLGRARALADLMSGHSPSEEKISVDQQSLTGIEKIISKESNCVCLYISFFIQWMFFWVLKPNKPILSRRIDVKDCFGNERAVENLDEFFEKEPLRNFHILPQERCEDRSLFPSSHLHLVVQSQEDAQAFRLIEEEEDEHQGPQPSLALYHKLTIAPVADLLDEPEIIIVPERSLYKVPFAALKDDSDRYLSKTFRIRIVPSLATLKLIQDRPADTDKDTNALIVGDPDVSHVFFLKQLSCARREAEMIAGLLSVKPLLGHEATKLAVLEAMHSARLIHIAAHGDAERGEIALAPVRPLRMSLQTEDYLLTMSDVSRVQLRAKLVVLSCCHSGRGQIRAEGVVGIARAFLGSGARSVLVALWALEDEATEQFMNCFYKHLVREESASESLHQAMKWMRSNGFSDVRQWAPFTLIGDNVTFTF